MKFILGFLLVSSERCENRAYDPFEMELHHFSTNCNDFPFELTNFILALRAVTDTFLVKPPLYLYRPLITEFVLFHYIVLFCIDNCISIGKIM